MTVITYLSNPRVILLLPFMSYFPSAISKGSPFKPIRKTLWHLLQVRNDKTPALTSITYCPPVILWNLRFKPLRFNNNATWDMNIPTYFTPFSVSSVFHNSTLALCHSNRVAKAQQSECPGLGSGHRVTLVNSMSFSEARKIVVCVPTLLLQSR